MPEKKSHFALITIIIVLILVGIGAYYFWVNLPQPSPDENFPIATTTRAILEAQAALRGTTTPEDDLSQDVLTGTDYDLSTGVASSTTK